MNKAQVGAVVDIINKVLPEGIDFWPARLQAKDYALYYIGHSSDPINVPILIAFVRNTEIVFTWITDGQTPVPPPDPYSCGNVLLEVDVAEPGSIEQIEKVIGKRFEAESTI